MIIGVWNNVANVQKDLEDLGIDIGNMLVKWVGRGDDILFWFDQWIGNMTLKIAFPKIYRMDKKKRCKVSERVQIGGPTWDWLPQSLNPEQELELQHILSLLGSFQPNMAYDQWRCPLTPNEVFCVKP